MVDKNDCAEEHRQHDQKVSNAQESAERIGIGSLGKISELEVDHRLLTAAEELHGLSVPSVLTFASSSRLSIDTTRVVLRVIDPFGKSQDMHTPLRIRN